MAAVVETRTHEEGRKRGLEDDWLSWEPAWGPKFQPTLLLSSSSSGQTGEPEMSFLSLSLSVSPRRSGGGAKRNLLFLLARETLVVLLLLLQEVLQLKSFGIDGGGGITMQLFFSNSLCHFFSSSVISGYSTAVKERG